MKKISPTCAMTTTALLALAGLAAPAAALSDAQATPAPATQQPLGPNGVPVAQQAPQTLRTNRPLLKPAMIDLDELAKQPRLKPGMQRRLPGVQTPSGEPVMTLPGVAPLSPLPAPAGDSVAPGIPGVVPVILPDQPRTRPVGWSVKPEEADTAPTPATTEPAVSTTDTNAVPGVQPASATPTVIEVTPNFAFPETVTASAPATEVAPVTPAEVPAPMPEVVQAVPVEVTTSSTPVLGPSRLTAFGSSDVATALPPTGVSMPSEIVGTMPVPASQASTTRMPQIEQSTTAFITPVMRDSGFQSNMPVISDRKPSSSTVVSTGLDENGQPLRPAVLPPEVREITIGSVTVPETPAGTPAPTLVETPVEPPVVSVLPPTTTVSEPQPQPVAAVEAPAVQPPAASTPAEQPAPSEPVVVVTTAETPAPATAPASVPEPEPAPMPAPLPGLTFRTPAPADAPASSETPASEPVKPEPVKVASTETPSEPAATAPVAPAAPVAQPEPSTAAAAAPTPETTPATPEPTFSNAVSAAAAKLAERAAAAASPAEPVAPAAVPAPEPVPAPAVEIAKSEPAPQPVAPALAPAPAPAPEPAVAIATDTGKPVEVLPAPTAGSAQDPFTAKGDGIAIRVTELTGTPGMVQWLRDGGNDWQIPELNEAGNGKYTIRTGPDAGAVVAINETTKLRVGRLSRAEVRAMTADAAGGQRRLVVALTRGRVAVIPAPGTAVNVYTPQSLVVVREPTEVIHDTASGTRTVAYVEKSPASAEVMTTP